MKRERILQVFLVAVGLLFTAFVYFLYIDLWQARWLVVKHNETNPMFLSVFIVLGPFLLLAARKPSANRSLILFASLWNLAHAAVMTIETIQSYNRGIPRDFKDVIIFAVIGLILLVLSPAARNKSAADLHA